MLVFSNFRRSATFLVCPASPLHAKAFRHPSPFLFPYYGFLVSTFTLRSPLANSFELP